MASLLMIKNCSLEQNIQISGLEELLKYQRSSLIIKICSLGGQVKEKILMLTLIDK